MEVVAWLTGEGRLRGTGEVCRGVQGCVWECSSVEGQSCHSPAATGRRSTGTGVCVMPMAVCCLSLLGQPSLPHVHRPSPLLVLPQTCARVVVATALVTTSSAGTPPRRRKALSVRSHVLVVLGIKLVHYPLCLCNNSTIASMQTHSSPRFLAMLPVPE